MKTVILVRHADINVGTGPSPDNTPLNAAGVARAQALARALGGAGLTTIITSSVLRTKQTAAPIVALTGLTPKVGSTAAQVKTLILANNAGDRILVVGHSDTVPQITAALGANLAGTFAGFDNLIIVSVPTGGQGASALRLKYGA